MWQTWLERGATARWDTTDQAGANVKGQHAVDVGWWELSAGLGALACCVMLCLPCGILQTRCTPTCCRVPAMMCLVLFGQLCPFCPAVSLSCTGV